jgi:hypothetical protein
MESVPIMKATQRLKLMRQIALKLGEEDKSIINLTLEQFRLPVSRSYRIESFEYILRQIATAKNEVLLDLAHHLDVPVVHARAGDNATFWKDGSVRLFISHLARKKEIAGDLRDELAKVGISAFVAHSDISPSKEWQQEIETALSTCDALVALMAEGFHKSYWTDQEVGFAFGRGLPIITVNMGEKPYGFIAKFQTCKFLDLSSLRDTIFKLLMTDQRTSQKMSDALITQFEKSNSFAAASQHLKLLKKIRHWDPAMIERVRVAAKKNNQIKGSFDVPEGVQTLLKKVKSKAILSS